MGNEAKSTLLSYQEEETMQPRHPIPGLPAPWVLSTAGKLLQFLRGPTSCLIITLLLMLCFSDIFLFLFFYFFFNLPSLSLYIRSANIRPVHSNSLSIVTRHAPLLLIGYKCFETLSDTVVKSVFQICLSAPLTWHNMKWLTQQKTKWLP